MSDARDQLIRCFESKGWMIGADELADIVLERFDVTPKPAVSDEVLGELVQAMNLGIDAWQYERFRGEVGRRMRRKLMDAGLAIVRVDE
jgi:hypothetical protein